MWSFGIYDTITGQPLADVFPSDGRWRRAISDGSGSHTFRVGDAGRGFPASTWRDLMQPNARTLAVRWAGAVVYAGMILDSAYNRTSGTLTVNHTDIRALFSQRLTFGVSTYGGGNLTVSNRSAAGAVRAILDRAVNSWGSTWRLPFDLPADSSGSLSFTWHNYEWSTIEDLLRQVEALGYQVDLQPYLDANGWLRWQTRVGAPLTGAQFEFPLTVDHPIVSNLTVRTDGAKQLSGCFYMGKGTEADMRFGEAGFVSGPTIPVRDAARSAKDVSDGDRLNSMAMTDLVEHRSPIVQWDFSLVATQDDSGNELLDIAALQPGARIRLENYGDPFLADGATNHLVLGLSGDMSRTVEPEVQPIG